MQPPTSDMPKPVIPVAGKPVMEYIVEHLARQGIGSELFPDLARRGLPFCNQCREFEWIDIGRVGGCWRIVGQLIANTTPEIPIRGVDVLPGVRTGLNVREMIVSGNCCVKREGHALAATDVSPDGGWWGDARALLPAPRRQDADASSMRSKR